MKYQFGEVVTIKPLAETGVVISVNEEKEEYWVSNRMFGKVLGFYGSTSGNFKEEELESTGEVIK